MKKYAFGVDVGGTTCKIGFFETDGKLIDASLILAIVKVVRQALSLLKSPLLQIYRSKGDFSF